MKPIITVFCFLMIVSCSCKSSYNELVTAQGPDPSKKDAAQTLTVDGSIIGIEKYRWKCVNKEKGLDSSRYQTPLPKTGNSEFFESLITKQKVMIVSHILSFKNGEKSREWSYDPYNNCETEVHCPELDYEKGYDQLDLFKTRLESDLSAGDYTHVIYMSMGWHNDQYEAVYRYNRIVEELVKKTEDPGLFKPYVVGITWPSAWASNMNDWIIEKAGHLFSYGNKTNDADEIGFTVSNYLLRNVILNAVSAVNNRTDQKIKTVGIGHSLGARIISRSVFSRAFLKNDESNGTQLDMLIGLQGAFSVNRFLDGEGKEDWPYADMSGISTKIVLTASYNDKGNPIAKFITGAAHVGGKFGLDKAKDAKFKCVFETAVWPEEAARLETSLSGGDCNPNEPVIVDASSIIEGKNAHNDILDSKMAELIWFCIKSL